MKIKQAEEKDVIEIRDLFVKVYGPDYPFREFYDTKWLTKSVYSDDTILMIAKDKDRIVAAGSVILTAGGLSDMVGEIGRLVVDTEYRRKGMGIQLSTALINAASEMIQFAFGELRTVHLGSQKISEAGGVVPGVGLTGFEPLKYQLATRESMVFFTILLENALSLRKNNPHVIPSVYPLAAKSMENLQLSVDLIVEDGVDGYTTDKSFDAEELKSAGVSPLLRIERGRVKNPEVFGNLSLSYGFFKIATNQATYLVAKERGITLGAIGFTVDNIDKKVKVLELIEFDDEVKGFLLATLDKLSKEKYGAEYIEIDVSAYSPQIQKTLERLGFVAVAYCPAMVFRGVERLDVIRMAKLNVPPEVGDIKLTPKSREMFELVMESLEDRKIGLTIAETTRKVDIFQGLSDGELSQLARICKMVSYPAGKTISREGETGKELFVLAEGKASVMNGKGEERTQIGTIGVGEIFGEMAIIEDLPRMAELVADKDSKLVVIDRSELQNLMNRNHHLGKVVMENIARGLSRKLRRGKSL